MEIYTGILFILSIIFFALKDAIYDNGKKSISKIFKLIAIACLLSVSFLLKPFAIDMHIRLIAAYPFIWFVLYDITYNLSRKPPLPWNYYGTTSGWYSAFRKKTQHFYPYLLFVSLLIALGLFFLKGGLL